MAFQKYIRQPCPPSTVERKKNCCMSVIFGIPKILCSILWTKIFVFLEFSVNTKTNNVHYYSYTVLDIKTNLGLKCLGFHTVNLSSLIWWHIKLKVKLTKHDLLSCNKGEYLKVKVKLTKHDLLSCNKGEYLKVKVKLAKYDLLRCNKGEYLKVKVKLTTHDLLSCNKGEG
jgi:hypothetical protein